MQYGLPVQIRDGVLQIKEVCPQNEANREYFWLRMQLNWLVNDVTLIDYDKTDPAAKAVLEQLSQKYNKNKTVESRNALYLVPSMLKELVHVEVNVLTVIFLLLKRVIPV